MSKRLDTIENKSKNWKGFILGTHNEHYNITKVSKYSNQKHFIIWQTSGKKNNIKMIILACRFDFGKGIWWLYYFQKKWTNYLEKSSTDVLNYFLPPYAKKTHLLMQVEDVFFIDTFQKQPMILQFLQKRK
jgi:hypothetical protein